MIRGGGGIFYSNYINQGLGLPAFGFSTTADFTTGDNGITPAFKWDGGFPQNFRRPPITETAAANGQSVTAVLPSDYDLPRKLQWNLTLEHQFSDDLSMGFAYVANKGTHLYERQELNQVPLQFTNLPVALLRANIDSPQAQAARFTQPFQGFSQLWRAGATVAQALRPFPQYNSVVAYGSTYGNSSYQSFQYKLDKRYKGGLSGTLAYTWSKFLTDARQFDDLFGKQNEYLREKSYHPSDLTHILTFSAFYELPLGRGKRWLSAGGALNKILGGWQLATVNSYNSGTRLAITTNNTLPYFNGSLRPDIVSVNVRSDVGLSEFDPAKHVFLNRDTFANPAPGKFGNAPRYLEQRGPGRLDESFAVMKNTRIAEKVTHQFRMEILNPLNRVVFDNPVTNLASTNFGRITGVQIGPRNIQFGMKFIW